MSGKMKRFSLAKSKRLVTSTQFGAVVARKQRFTDGLFVLYVAENDCKISRLGIAINKSIGSAVVRNRLKRLIREVFRINQHDIPQGFDYLFTFSSHWQDKLSKYTVSDEIISKSIKGLGLEQVRNSMINLIAKAFKKTK